MFKFLRKIFSRKQEVVKYATLKDATVAINLENKKYLKENPVSSVVPFPVQPPINHRYRKLICEVEEYLKTRPESLYADAFPLKHSFAEGVYMREFYSPKGMFIVTKLHTEAYFSWLKDGDVTVLNEKGGERLQGPCLITSPAGAKRIIYAHEAFTWITTHPNPTNSTNIEELEARIHAESYTEIGEPIDDVEVDISAIIDNFVKHIEHANEEIEARRVLCQV